MADPIDRQWLMERLKIKDDCRECQYSQWPLCSKGSEFVDACEAISDAPSIEPESRWIPMAVKHPSDGQLILVQFVNGAHTVINFSDVGLKDHIVAWMPLPEPYKEDSDG